ncbi:sigma-70 family RNA polymerase sigma factor [Chitinophaga agrisoli]|uniref:Sigma-70 family RNA polymerase sigma factor n=1 Tax=Chitinophaga agrisoli TaxID=2607653 RepID=A0A5B2VJJ4_9BACT|nr:sigma-70 family RNA polymerase sigma factor [Chitinophaga agrisoli]KAA2239753.1 sigma-70 family RNA polymerase sigma factor [Chitinophaga agrisoli]
MPSVTDSVLLQHLKAGDSQAFETCFKLYRKDLMTTALAILQNEADAKDLVQEFFIDFWEKQLYKHIDSSLKGFLILAIKNRCINQLSKNDTRRRRLEQLFQQTQGAVLPDNRLEQQEQQQALSSALQQLLPAQTLKVVQLAYLDGKNRKEIAIATGTSPNTIRNQLVSALKLLRKNFKRQ